MISDATASGTQNSDTMPAINSIERGLKAQSSNNRVILPVESNVVIENIHVTAKSTPPQIITQHHHVVMTACLVIVRDDRPAQRHRHAETGEEVARHRLSPDPLRFSLAADARGNERKVSCQSSFKQVTALDRR